MAINIIWFRRDLRLHDNAALYHALKAGEPVLPIFIFDKYILDGLEDKQDRRVVFIHAALEEMQEQLLIFLFNNVFVSELEPVVSLRV